MIKPNEETANACYLENEPLDELLERTEKRVFELAENGNSQEYVPIKQVVLNALDVIEKASKTKGNVPEYRQGSSTLITNCPVCKDQTLFL